MEKGFPTATVRLHRDGAESGRDTQYPPTPERQSLHMRGSRRRGVPERRDGEGLDRWEESILLTVAVVLRSQWVL